MAGTKYGSFAVGDANIDNVMLQLAGVETGYCALTLTNMTNTAVPHIAAGSKIEVGGSLFKFDANETITGSATTGTNYIRLVPSGSSITAAWTTTAPTWSDSKQGWYDGTGAYRYAPFYVIRNGTVYNKYEIIFNNTSITPVRSVSGVLDAPLGLETTTLNVTTGVKFSGAFVAGFLADGTPFYRKYISFTWPSSGSATLAHGISGAVSSRRIISAFSGFYFGGTGQSVHYANVNAYMYAWDDTNITVTSSLAVNTTAYICIDYK